MMRPRLVNVHLAFLHNLFSFSLLIVSVCIKDAAKHSN
jgi:hypothetical protein